MCRVWAPAWVFRGGDMAEETRKEAVIQALCSSSFLQGLSTGQLESIAAVTEPVIWAADQVIFREGEPDDKLYIITEGLVALEMAVPTRGRMNILTVGPDEILGWSSMIPAIQNKTASARTLRPTRALAIDAPELCAICEKDHDLGYLVFRAVADVVSSRLRATRIQVLDIYKPGKGE